MIELRQLIEAVMTGGLRPLRPFNFVGPLITFEIGG